MIPLSLSPVMAIPILSIGLSDPKSWLIAVCISPLTSSKVLVHVSTESTFPTIVLFASIHATLALPPHISIQRLTII
jgi:hypothetical protein